MMIKTLLCMIIFIFELFSQTYLNKNWLLLNKDSSQLVSNNISAIFESNDNVYWICSVGDNFSSYLQTYYNGNWVTYDSTNSPLNKSIGISDITQTEDGKLLFGTTNNGLYIKTGEIWDSLNTSNSPLPDNFIFRITVDKLNRYWLGIPNYGVAVYDNGNWILYNDNNSFNGIGDFNFIDVDSLNTIWIGTDFFGLYGFDGNNWVRRIKGLFGGGGENNMITDLAVDPLNHKWCSININGGGWKIGYSEDDSIWVYYDSTDIGFSIDLLSYNGAVIDQNNIKYFGTTDGMLVYDNFTWSILDTSNSSIPANWFNKGMVDSKNNKIFILESFYPYYQDYGLILYNQDSVIVSLVDNLPPVMNAFYLSQNFPNPFNPITNIKFCIPISEMVQIKVYDILGNEIKTLLNEYKQAGTYEVRLDTRNLPSGIYFYRIIIGGYSESKKMILLR